MIWTLLTIMVFYLPETAYNRYYYLSAAKLEKTNSDITLEYHDKDMHQVLLSLPAPSLLSKFTGSTSHI